VQLLLAKPGWPDTAGGAEAVRAARV
jgi:hypothetical protein